MYNLVVVDCGTVRTEKDVFLSGCAELDELAESRRFVEGTTNEINAMLNQFSAMDEKEYFEHLQSRAQEIADMLGVDIKDLEIIDENEEDDVGDYTNPKSNRGGKSNHNQDNKKPTTSMPSLSRIVFNRDTARKAWREIARGCHPDKNPDTDLVDLFAPARDAYECNDYDSIAFYLYLVRAKKNKLCKESYADALVILERYRTAVPLIKESLPYELLQIFKADKKRAHWLYKQNRF